MDWKITKSAPDPVNFSFLRQSDIFDGSEKKKKGKRLYETDDGLEEDEEGEENKGIEKVDLTDI